MNQDVSLATEFAPAERATVEQLRHQAELLALLDHTQLFVNAIPAMAIVLNRQRQIVFANKAFLKFVDKVGLDTIMGECSEAQKGNALVRVVGLRPGEAVGCVRARLSSGGCGTTRFCRTCGAVMAILNSQQGKEDVQECRMVHLMGDQPEALDLRVWASPVLVKGEGFTLVTIEDISNEKRRQALERIFFHDVLNTAGGVQGLASMLVDTETADEDVHELGALIRGSAEHLVEEITTQRILVDAENHELKPVTKPVALLPFVREIVDQFAAHDVASDKTLAVSPQAAEVILETDPILLRRVVVNLIKNALEASAKGETVNVTVRPEAEGASLTVHNSIVMPESVRNQIFNRSFTTRGTGRGLGTYSAKLLTERYLRGRISFESQPGAGTTFTVRLPR